MSKAKELLELIESVNPWKYANTYNFRPQSRTTQKRPLYRPAGMAEKPCQIFLRWVKKDWDDNNPELNKYPLSLVRGR